MRGFANESDHIHIRRASMHGLIALKARGILAPNAINLTWDESLNRSFRNLDEYLTYNFYPADSAKDFRRWGQTNDLLGLSFFLQRNCLVIEHDTLNNYFRYRVFIPGQNVYQVCSYFYIHFIVFIDKDC